MANRSTVAVVPKFVELLTAYQLLGIDNLLGVEGKNTAFSEGGRLDETIVFHVVPGQWSCVELADLIDTAMTMYAPPVVLRHAA